MKLNQLVELAQSGERDAIEALLSKYGWSEDYEFRLFLGKYINTLWYGSINLKNKETRKFLRLYISDPEVNHKMKWPNLDSKSYFVAQQTLNFLQSKIREHYNLRELKHDIVLAFLELLNKYEKQPSINFSGYIYGTFRFEVYKILQQRIFSYDVLLSDKFSQEIDIPFEDRELFKLENDHIKYIDSLDFFWINGEAGDLFSILSPLERTILRDWYLYKKTDAEIAYSNGYHRNSILNKRHQAVNKLIKYKKELGE